MIHKNGAFVYVQANVKKFGINRLLAIVRDVKELHKIQRQIEISESTFRGAFENSPIGMGLVSPGRKWLRVNKQLCLITGYSQEEMLSLNFADITYPADKANDIYYLQQCICGNI